MNMLEPVDVQCPYCGERVTLLIDCPAGPQEYTEDCQVCCQPMVIAVAVDADGVPQVQARREDD